MKNSSKSHLNESTWLTCQLGGGLWSWLPWGRWQAGEKIILSEQLNSHKNCRSNRASNDSRWLTNVSCPNPRAEEEFTVMFLWLKQSLHQSPQRNYCAKWLLLWERNTCLAPHKSFGVRLRQNLFWVTSFLQHRKYSSFYLKILNAFNVKN